MNKQASVLYSTAPTNRKSIVFKREECENSREKKFVASRLFQFFPHPPTKAIHFAQPDSSRPLSGEKCSIKQPALYQQAKKQLSERLNNLTLCRRLKTRRATDRFFNYFFFSEAAAQQLVFPRAHNSRPEHDSTFSNGQKDADFPPPPRPTVRLVHRRRFTYLVQYHCRIFGGLACGLCSPNLGMVIRGLPSPLRYSMEQ